MAKKKIEKEAYASRGMKTKKQPVGMHKDHQLDDGYHSCADGNDGSKAPASAPESKHKLKKYS